MKPMYTSAMPSRQIASDWGQMQESMYGVTLLLGHVTVIISAGLTPLPDVGGLDVMVLWYLLT